MTEYLDRARAWHDAIRKALLDEWDPIGVREISEAQDEYDHYVPAIYRLLVTRRPDCELIDYLWWLETEHMGLSGDRQATEAFAEYLQGIAEKLESVRP